MDTNDNNNNNNNNNINNVNNNNNIINTHAQMGNGLAAVLAGVLAQLSADRLGDIGPFQATK